MNNKDNNNKQHIKNQRSTHDSRLHNGTSHPGNENHHHGNNKPHHQNHQRDRQPLRVLTNNHHTPHHPQFFNELKKSPKESIDDFNKNLGSYAEDIHECQKEDEERHWRNRKWNCFTIQTEVTEQMRSILIDWLCEVTEEYNLTLNTLFLTVNYVDRILEEYSIPRSKLQLLGVSCMLIACKFEEIHPPLVEDFVYITDNTYSRDEIIRTELLSLNTLKFSLTTCTIKNFLTRFLLISEVRDPRIVYHSNYLAELTLPDYTIHQKYKPSLIAAAITCISKFTFRLPAVTPVFELYCGYTKSEILPCIQHLYELHGRITQAPLGALTSAREKYKLPKYASVSLALLPLELINM